MTKKKAKNPLPQSFAAPNAADAKVAQQIRVMETIGANANSPKNTQVEGVKRSPETKAYIKRLTPVLGFCGYDANDIATLVVNCDHDEAKIQRAVAQILEGDGASPNKGMIGGWEVKKSKQQAKDDKKIKEEEERIRAERRKELLAKQEQARGAQSVNSFSSSPPAKETKSATTSGGGTAFQDPAILFMGAKPGETSLCSTASSEAGELWPTGNSSGETLTQEEKTSGDAGEVEDEWREWDPAILFTGNPMRHGEEQHILEEEQPHDTEEDYEEDAYDEAGEAMYKQVEEVMQDSEEHDWKEEEGWSEKEWREWWQNNPQELTPEPGNGQATLSPSQDTHPNSMLPKGYVSGAIEEDGEWEEPDPVACGANIWEIPDNPSSSCKSGGLDQWTLGDLRQGMGSSSKPVSTTGGLDQWTLGSIHSDSKKNAPSGLDQFCLGDLRGDLRNELPAEAKPVSVAELEKAMENPDQWDVPQSGQKRTPPPQLTAAPPRGAPGLEPFTLDDIRESFGQTKASADEQAGVAKPAEMLTLAPPPGIEQFQDPAILFVGSGRAAPGLEAPKAQPSAQTQQPVPLPKHATEDQIRIREAERRAEEERQLRLREEEEMQRRLHEEAEKQKRYQEELARLLAEQEKQQAELQRLRDHQRQQEEQAAQQQRLAQQQHEKQLELQRLQMEQQRQQQAQQQAAQYPQYAAQQYAQQQQQQQQQNWQQQQQQRGGWYQGDPGHGVPPAPMQPPNMHGHGQGMQAPYAHGAPPPQHQQQWGSSLPQQQQQQHQAQQHQTQQQQWQYAAQQHVQQQMQQQNMQHSAQQNRQPNVVPPPGQSQQPPQQPPQQPYQQQPPRGHADQYQQNNAQASSYNGYDSQQQWNVQASNYYPQQQSYQNRNSPYPQQGPPSHHY